MFYPLRRHSIDSLVSRLRGFRLGTKYDKRYSSTLHRSYLYVPTSSDRMLEKSISSGSDVIIYDLEDSVPPAPSEKVAARMRLEEFLEVSLKGPARPNHSSSHLIVETARRSKISARSCQNQRCNDTLLPRGYCSNCNAKLFFDLHLLNLTSCFFWMFRYHTLWSKVLFCLRSTPL